MCENQIIPLIFPLRMSFRSFHFTEMTQQSKPVPHGPKGLPGSSLWLQEIQQKGSDHMSVALERFSPKAP